MNTSDCCVNRHKLKFLGETLTREPVVAENVYDHCNSVLVVLVY